MTHAAVLAIAAVLAVGGRAAGWLTSGGALAAFAVGTAILAGSGLAGAALLALFFLSSSILTSANERRGLSNPDAKGGRRDARQVIANGGWAGLGALLIDSLPPVGWAVLVGALASAQADTWATEIGAHAARRPRLITTGRAVARGTSGAVTALGTLGGLAGTVSIAGLALAVEVPRTSLLAGAIGGVAGLLVDSYLGATLQARFRCAACGTATERATHRCGTTSVFERGWRWLDNDAVNFVSTGFGAASAGVAVTAL